ncbi:MAG: metallophosphoesterase family protein [Chloroflexota bacterium]
MKIAVLADIHANLAALQTVTKHLETWAPDEVIMAGDVVNRGPYPAECLQLVLQKQAETGWHLVRGNHEDYVLENMRPDAPQSGPRLDIYRNSFWTLAQLNGEVKALEAMPFQVSLTGPDGREVRAVHASMAGNRIGIYPALSDKVLRPLIAPPPAVLCVGHTHRPLIRQVDKTLVVNVGSVGMSFDGDRRASYAQLSWHNGRWQAEIIRLAYDWTAVEQAFFDSGFMTGVGDLGRIMLIEFQQARPYLHQWLHQYEDRVLAEELSLAQSVTNFFQDVILTTDY